MLGINKHIRLAGVAGNISDLVVQAYREGLSPLLNERESRVAVGHTMMYAATRGPLKKNAERGHLFIHAL